MTKKLQELTDNAAISNPDVTREQVDEVVDEQPHQRYVVLAEPLVNGSTRDGTAEQRSPSFVEDEMAMKSHSLGFMDKALHHMVKHLVLDDPYYQDLDKLATRLHAEWRKSSRRLMLGLAVHALLFGALFVVADRLWSTFRGLWIGIYISAAISIMVLASRFFNKRAVRAKAALAACILWLQHEKKIDHTAYTAAEINVINRWLTEHKA